MNIVHSMPSDCNGPTAQLPRVLAGSPVTTTIQEVNSMVTPEYPSLETKETPQGEKEIENTVSEYDEFANLSLWAGSLT